MTYTEITLKQLGTNNQYLVKVNEALTLYELNIEFNRQHGKSVEVIFINNGRPLPKYLPTYQLFNMPDLRISLLDAYTCIWTSEMILRAMETDPYVLLHAAYFVQLLNPELSNAVPSIVTSYIKGRLHESDFSIPVMYVSEFQDPVANLSS